MELFLSLSNRPKKAPYTKHRIIDIFETTTSSIPETKRTILSNYQHSSLPYKSSLIKEKTFSKQKINLKLRANTDLIFTKIRPSNNLNTSNEVDTDDEQKVIESLQEGIKQLPNGKFCIQPGKIFQIHPKTNTTMINNSKSEITNVNNSSTTICSNNNTLLCKRMSILMNTNKTRNTISTSSSMNINKVSSTKKIAQRISPNYQSKAFTNYIRVNNIVSNQCTNTKSKAVINTRETKRKMNIYKNHFTKKIK